MVEKRQEINQLGLTREQKLQTELQKIYPEQASEWSAKIISFLNGEGRGNWKMIDVENGCELQYGKFLDAFKIVIMSGETHYGTPGMVVACGKIENVILVQENPEKRSLTILMTNAQNAKMVVRKGEGNLCVCLSRREINGVKNNH